jgi:hypothetical protein
MTYTRLTPEQSKRIYDSYRWLLQQSRARRNGFERAQREASAFLARAR